MHRRKLLAALGGAALWPLATARAQGTWPVRPVRIVTPSPPGGGGDVSLRVIARYMGEFLGQPMVIDNRVGGNGVVAALEALRGGTDGYTVYAGSNTTLAANPYLMKTMNYDPTDFTPVALLGTLPFILVVNPGVPAQSVRELIAHARANPGKLTYASANATSLVAASMFERMAGVKMLNVPYKSAPASLNDIASGQVALSFIDIPSAQGMVSAGRVRVLGITSARKSPLLPSAPAIAETLPGYELIGWTAMTVPTGTPKLVIDRLGDSIQRAVARPDVREQLLKLGFEAATMPAAEFPAFMRSERPRWARLIRSAGIVPE